MQVNNSTVFDCSLIYLPKIGDRNGIITSVNGNNELCTEIKRVFFLGDFIFIFLYKFLVAFKRKVIIY